MNQKMVKSITKTKVANFKDIFGVWSKSDEKAFYGKTSDFERVDREDWP
ncbi:hypothetical protein HYU96_00055 [Candidatus Daviesbacteria bacterium]|nr:hypothetical protein [Candidatus Daviesbacteria bacterium]